MFEHLDDPLEFVVHDTFRRGVLTRGRRLRARRRLTTLLSGATLAGVLVGALLVIAGRNPAPNGDGGDDGDVRTEPPAEADQEPRVATAAPSVALDPAALVTAPDGLTVTPSTGLDDGDFVQVSLARPAESATFGFVCAAEVLALPTSDDPPVAPWCTPGVSLAGDGGEMFVVRRLRTPDGIVDCAEAAGRCIVGVAAEDGSAPSSYAPIELAASGSEPAQIRVFGAAGPVDDGGVVRIEAEGFTPREPVSILLCTGDTCDSSGRDGSVEADADGRFEVDFTVFHDIGVLPEGSAVADLTWTACRPCRLRLTEGGGQVVLDVEVAPTEDPVHPEIAIVPDGPLSPGGSVRIEGSGFQPDDEPDFDIGWCRSDPEPSSEVAGPDSTFSGCRMPPEGRPRSVGSPARPSLEPNPDGFVVDAEGRLVIDDFPLPDETTRIQGTLCAGEPGACVLEWIDLRGLHVRDRMVPLDLSG